MGTTISTAPPAGDTGVKRDSAVVTDICARMIDEDKQEFCDKPAADDIIVSNVSGKYLVPLCEEHSKVHRDFYRTRRQVRRKHGRVIPKT